MQNDTILNSRQEQILKILKDQGFSSRLKLTDLIVSRKKVSKITLIRDLNQLIEQNFIKVTGKGKATKYELAKKNPFLEYIDLDKYFQTDYFSRKIKKGYSSSIFTHLTDLYSAEEKFLWERSVEIFKKAKKELDHSIYKRELERFVIELSWKSSQIEGNTYSLIEAETLIKQNIVAKNHPQDEALMILNHKKAFDVILDKKKSFRHLSLSDILQLHNVLTQGLISSGIRFQEVRITGTNYVPMSHRSDLENALRKVIGHVNQLEYPPEKALVLSAMIAYLQPFADGNKRTSRMIANAVLLAYDYFPLSYRNVDVNEYRSAMVIFYEQNNLYHLKRIFIEQLEFASNNYFQ